MKGSEICDDKDADVGGDDDGGDDGSDGRQDVSPNARA